MRYLILLFFIVFSSIFNSPLEAQYFEKLNGPYGGGAQVWEGKNGVLFQLISVNTDNKTLFKSLNGGSSWLRINNIPALNYHDLVSMGYNGILYSYQGEKLFVSVNDGQSWSSINSPGVLNPSVFTALPNGYLLLASGNQIFQSTNNGLNWSNFVINDPSGVDAIFFNVSSNKAYAISDTRVFVSADLGLSWQLLYEDDFGQTEKNMVFASNGDILISGDGPIQRLDSNGNLIQKIYLPSMGTLDHVEIALSNSGRLFAYRPYVSYYSDNLGNTWIETGSVGNGQIAFKSFSTTSAGIVFGVRPEGSLYRSADNGLTWNFAANGIPYATIHELDFISDLKIIALTSDGLFYSEDEGKSWTYFFVSHHFANGTQGLDFVVNEGDEIYFSDYNSIYYFADWKTTPTVLRNKLNATGAEKLFINNQTHSIFSLESNGFFRTTNKGKNWNKISSAKWFDFNAFPDGSILVTADSGVYKSKDNGDTYFQVVSQNLRNYNKILSNAYTSAYIFFFDKSRKLLSSVDLGETWQLNAVDGKNANFIEPLYGQAVNNIDYIYTGGIIPNVYSSVDFGKNFNSLTNELPYFTNSLDISPNQKLYASVAQNGLYRSRTATSSEKVLKGQVFKDLNKNCIKDPGEPVISNQLVEAVSGAVREAGYTNANGDFRLAIRNQGTYIVNAAIKNNYWTSCSQTIVTTNFNFNDTLAIGLKVNTLCPNMEVDLQASRFRRCRESDLFMNYKNTGTEKAVNAYVDLKLDDQFELITASLPFTKIGDVYRFLVGDVIENQSGFIEIRIKVNCDAKDGQEHCSEAHIYPDSSCVSSTFAQIVTSATCTGDSINLSIKNTGTIAMSTEKQWYAIDEHVTNKIVILASGKFLLNAGEEITITIPSAARVLFVAEQDASYPFSSVSQTRIISCASNPAPGAPPFRIINLDESEFFISKFCERNRNSFDPNEIKGYPEGLTDRGYINVNQELEYIIRFQNTGTDTAFNVRIENKIPLAELDLSSFSAGAASHPYQFILSKDGNLIFSFRDILLPDSSSNEQASHGFVQYKIKPIKKLGNGTEIKNKAQIYFDFNVAINTNIDLHTIGVPVIVTTEETSSDNAQFLQITPNPLTSVSYINNPHVDENEIFSLHCIDMHSKEIWKQNFKGHTTIISRGNMHNGVYLLVLKDRHGMTIAVNKLLVE
jgi:uncharacterized repeat protein (TIGR01451 family)